MKCTVKLLRGNGENQGGETGNGEKLGWGETGCGGMENVNAYSRMGFL